MERIPVPLRSAYLGISEAFPRPNRQHLIESSIEDRDTIDVLPFNRSTDGSLSDRYVEFVINPLSAFINLNDIVLEIKGSVAKSDGSAWIDSDKLDFASNGLHSMIKSAQVYMNGTLVESNQYYAHTAMIKALTSFRKNDLDSFGRLMGLHGGTDGVSSYNQAYFDGLNDKAKTRIADLKSRGFHFKGKLYLDISTVSQYLLNSVEIRIKLELNSDQLIINSLSGVNPRVLIESARLHISALKPRENASLGLDKSLELTPLTYSFQKLLYKSHIIPTNATMYTVEGPFLTIVPQFMYLCMVDLRAFSGTDYSKNSFYFNHYNIKELQVTVNSKLKYCSTAKFPGGAASLLYDTLSSLNGTDHLIDYESFMNGSSIMCLDLAAEKLEDYHPTQSGNLRINITLQNPIDHNVILFILGQTDGLIEIDSSRKVTLSVLG